METNTTTTETTPATNQETTQTSTVETPPVNDTATNNTSTVENVAYKDLYEQQKAEYAKLQEELNQAKILNAKLAITQPSKPSKTAEELLNEMFS